MIMSWSCYESERLWYKTSRYINAIILHSIVPRTKEHNMGKVRGVEKIEKVRKIIETIEKIR